MARERRSSEVVLRVRDYDLAKTLLSGQVFRWHWHEGAWEGVLGSRWVRLEPGAEVIRAQVAEPAEEWQWLTHFLQIEADLAGILETFPADAPMQAAVAACRGLRLLRQDPWECLASFILSSSKQIVQIQQVIAALCRNFGQPVNVPSGHARQWSFPAPEIVAAANESELRACKMGYRAPNLLRTARMVAKGDVPLEKLGELSLKEARECLLGLPGVGRKVADCVLLFAYGFERAFPVDVWVLKALRQLYFPRRRPKPRKIREFAETHFGPHAGYAQQYLFYFMRASHGRIAGSKDAKLRS